jgi:hypothetical protein
VGWPPPRRWWITTGIAVAVAVCAGIVLGLTVRGDSKKSPSTHTVADEPTTTMTGVGFTASRVGVSCQVRVKLLRCSRAGLGNATMTAAGDVTIDPAGDRVQGGPALAPGQDWKSLGMRCFEERGGLHCLAEKQAKGFFVDGSGFVER